MSDDRPQRRRPEVLAPAGDPEMMRAAVLAGADAVYFGLHGFNARARATNFDVGGLRETMRSLHQHGVKGYVALNTLVFDAELEGVEAAIRACAGAGVDAVIVQDLGVARMVKAIAPGLALHASTQMTCTDAGAVELAKSLGAARVILARELSLQDIADIKAKTDMELEVFVHGALCIAYSGQCLTSEAIGGRSANRGACAQACRLPYELLVDGEPRDLGDRAFLLSPEDLEASEIVPRLIEMGIASLKIEGRLKKPEYVAATTKLYRAAIDASPDLDRDLALQMYSRGSGTGFFRGVDHQRLVEGRSCDHRGLEVGEVSSSRVVSGKSVIRTRLSREVSRGDGVLIEGGFGGDGEIGGRIWTMSVAGKDVEHANPGDDVELWLGPTTPTTGVTPKRRLFRTDSPAMEKSVRTSLGNDPPRLAIDVVVLGAIGEMPEISATTERGVTATVRGDAAIVLGATQRTDEAILRDKLGRLGESPFVLRGLRTELEAGAMIPLSSLNRARRELVTLLIDGASLSHEQTNITHHDLLVAAVTPDRAPPPAGLFVLCRTLEQALAAADAGADGVYLDFLELTGTGEAVRALRARGSVHITLAPPRIRKPGEEKIDKFLTSLAPDALLVRGLGALLDSADSSIARVGDFSLNVTNRLTAHEVLARGCIAFTPSFDLDAAQLVSLLDSAFAPFAEVVVHHPMPLFHMEHCVIAALLSEGRDHLTCGRPCDRHQVSLKDRAGSVHPVEADVGCRNTVFHGSAQSAAGVVPELARKGVARFRIELLRENRAAVSDLVSTYRALLRGETAPAEVFQRLRAESGYGVVRGSLRVLSG